MTLLVYSQWRHTDTAVRIALNSHASVQPKANCNMKAVFTGS